MKMIQVDLRRDTYHYQVKIGSSNYQSDMKELLSHLENPDLYIVTNKTVDHLYPEFERDLISVSARLHKLVLPDGEQFKNITTISKIYDFLAENKANRKSVIIAFGGGVIGDMAGYSAATFMRGIPYIQIPTTLLSQVDSSIGGKTGVNHKAGKNFIGSFKQPLQTIIDVDFLNTLSEREFVAGYGELIKHAFIHDPYLFQLLNRTDLKALRSNKNLLTDVVFRSCEVKARVVEKDEKESGQRAILNFGHTLGHFLETLTHYKKFLHGEALIPGMDFAAWWSFQKGDLDSEEYQLIHQHLISLNIKLKIPEISEKQFQSIIERDKKSDQQGMVFIGLTSIGSARINKQVKSEDLWQYFCRYLKEQDGLLVI
ncbi:MAG: 3-dehydroquinate synthase [Proteobacteria bacterium]|nr:3-dehydroquinate synthase [Pseudomonadota bacterium]